MTDGQTYRHRTTALRPRYAKHRAGKKTNEISLSFTVQLSENFLTFISFSGSYFIEDILNTYDKGQPRLVNIVHTFPPEISILRDTDIFRNK